MPKVVIRVSDILLKTVLSNQPSNNTLVTCVFCSHVSLCRSSFYNLLPWRMGGATLVWVYFICWVGVYDEGEFSKLSGKIYCHFPSLVSMASPNSVLLPGCNYSGLWNFVRCHRSFCLDSRVLWECLHSRETFEDTVYLFFFGGLLLYMYVPLKVRACLCVPVHSCVCAWQETTDDARGLWIKELITWAVLRSLW